LAQVVRPSISGMYLNQDFKDSVRMVMGCPGWGEARSKAAVKKGGTAGEVLRRIMARDYKWFEGVAGVGKGLVDKAADFLEQEVT
jgi:hypothetical protein